MTNLAHLVASVESISDATAEQHAISRSYVAEHAPDLIEAIWGMES